jgi:hypothetical protein
VFLVNSRLGQFTAAPSGSRREAGHPTGASLLPKLRDHFAEFLNEGSLDHLGMLYLPTCVGFGTGAFPLPRGFSRGHGLNDFAADAARQSPLGRMDSGFSWSPSYRVVRGRPAPRFVYPSPSPLR